MYESLFHRIARTILHPCRQRTRLSAVMRWTFSERQHRRLLGSVSLQCQNQIEPELDRLLGLVSLQCQVLFRHVYHLWICLRARHATACHSLNLHLHVKSSLLRRNTLQLLPASAHSSMVQSLAPDGISNLLRRHGSTQTVYPKRLLQQCIILTLKVQLDNFLYF